MVLSDFLSGIIDKIIKLLPLDPFKPIINNLATLPYLGWLNWFFPIGTFLTILTAWLAAITGFYIYMAIARWLKLIQ